MTYIEEDTHFSSVLGKNESKEIYNVGPGCIEHILYIVHYPGITALHYDLETYFRIDLSESSEWLQKNRLKAPELIGRFGTPYTSDEHMQTFLALNDGCNAHEPKESCYEPMIRVQYEEDKPRWLFLKFMLTC